MDETSSLLLNMGTRSAAYNELLKSKMMNNQVGDNNYSTSVQILTLFAEATGMPHSYCSSFFTEATKRGNKHFQYIIKQFLAMVLSSFPCVFGDD